MIQSSSAWPPARVKAPGDLEERPLAGAPRVVLARRPWRADVDSADLGVVHVRVCVHACVHVPVRESLRFGQAPVCASCVLPVSVCTLSSPGRQNLPLLGGVHPEPRDRRDERTRLQGSVAFHGTRAQGTSR